MRSWCGGVGTFNIIRSKCWNLHGDNTMVHHLLFSDHNNQSQHCNPTSDYKSTNENRAFFLDEYRRFDLIISTKYDICKISFVILSTHHGTLFLHLILTSSYSFADWLYSKCTLLLCSVGSTLWIFAISLDIWS